MAVKMKSIERSKSIKSFQYEKREGKGKSLSFFIIDDKNQYYVDRLRLQQLVRNLVLICKLFKPEKDFPHCELIPEIVI